MLKFLFKLGISAVLAYAVWHVGSAYVTHYKLKDAAEQAALTPGITDKQLRGRVMQLAEEAGADLDDGHLDVRREGGHVFVDASYVQSIEVFPGVLYPWRFAWTVNVLTIPPMGITPKAR